jgi:hypothetical protein
MGIAARLDDLGKPAWIALMVLGFVFYWPVGLAVLAFIIWSGRMSCWKHEHAGRWQSNGNHRGPDWSSHWFGHRRQASSGNLAFDEYREETLRRLEEEQKEFKDFLTRLRFAKDKAEFDEFLADRRRRSSGPEPQPQN